MKYYLLTFGLWFLLLNSTPAIAQDSSLRQKEYQCKIMDIDGDENVEDTTLAYFFYENDNYDDLRVQYKMNFPFNITLNYFRMKTINQLFFWYSSDEDEKLGPENETFILENIKKRKDLYFNNISQEIDQQSYPIGKLKTYDQLITLKKSPKTAGTMTIKCYPILEITINNCFSKNLVDAINFGVYLNDVMLNFEQHQENDNCLWALDLPKTEEEDLLFKTIIFKSFDDEKKMPAIVNYTNITSLSDGDEKNGCKYNYDNYDYTFTCTITNEFAEK